SNQSEPRCVHDQHTNSRHPEHVLIVLFWSSEWQIACFSFFRLSRSLLTAPATSDMAGCYDPRPKSWHSPLDVVKGLDRIPVRPWAPRRRWPRQSSCCGAAQVNALRARTRQLAVDCAAFAVTPVMTHGDLNASNLDPAHAGGLGICAARGPRL